jgi:hypothetical protein
VGLARQSYAVDAAPEVMRARALSAMAGLSRLGFLLGPFLGAAVVHLVGTRGGFLVQLVAVVAAGAPLPCRALGGPRAAGGAVVSLLVFAAAHVALPLTAGAVTLGADAAPVHARAEFLGAWRLCHELGMLAGPAAAAMARWVPRRPSRPRAI